MINPPASDHQPVLVLGMHRSGTSCLAGSLEEAGLYLGQVNTAAPHNARGNRESRAIMDLQDDLLRANGGNWDAPPREVIWAAEHRARRDAIISTYPTDRVWGFKDPRTLLTLSGWLEVFPSARFVGTFRHPLAVAASLHARNGIPLEKSLELWEIHNRLLLDYQRQFGFSLISFDGSPTHYDQRLRSIVASLQLHIPSAGFSFFETTLRKNSAPEKASLLHRILAPWRTSTSRPNDKTALPASVIKLHNQLQEMAA